MVSAVDRGDDLIILDVDFERSKQWLLEAEAAMSSIFSEGWTTPDFRSQDELIHFIKSQDKGQGIGEDRIIREARRLMPIYAVKRTVEVLEQSGVIRAVGFDAKTQMKRFKFNAE